MMKNRMIILLIGLIGSLGFSLRPYAQDTWINGPLSPGRLPVERILLQTDRDMYMTGEDIWFTATCSLTRAETMEQMSHVLYIELFNSQNEVIFKEKFPIRNSMASGCMDIPSETGTDAYLLRAYTNYQRNFPPESYAMKFLTIINPDLPYQQQPKASGEIIIIPEGGDLVSGYPARIAIRVNPESLGVSPDAQLTDEHKRFAGQVNLLPNGLGVCEFIPQDSLSYSLRIIRKEGDTITEPLIASENSGFVPSLRRTPEGMVYYAEGKIPDSDYKGDSLILSLKSADMITLQEIRLNRPQMPLNVVIPYPDDCQGMIYLVLKGTAGDILHVLPAFIPPEKSINVMIDTEKPTYNVREKVQIHLRVPELPDETTRLAVSVVKRGLKRMPGTWLNESFIRNPFLIHSLSGQDEEWDEGLIKQADLCMILYTPYVNTLFFRSLLEDSDRKGLSFLPDIRDVSLSGQVIHKNTGQGVARAQVMLSVLGQSQFHMAKTDRQGRFVFPLNHLTGEQQVFLSPQPGDGQYNEILVNQDFSSQFPDHLELFPVLDSSIMNLIEETWINAQVMLLKPPSVPLAEPMPVPDALFAEDRIKVVLSDYIEMENLNEVFLEIIPFVQIRKKKDHHTVQITNDRLEVFEDPLILLDNVPVGSIDELLKVPPALVDRIEIINHPYIHGDFVLNGVLMVYTYTHNFAGSAFPAGSVFLDYQTITPQVPFPLYDYSTREMKADRLPDFRNVLYWDPGLTMTGKEVQFSFYTSDHCGEYDIIIRGTGEHGGSYFGKATIRIAEGD
ncbi:MAG: carboxypeptidase-like regulatory domain-containing protein [Bacteroidales bacterium]|nr:carboxypeptidase-like regulatory domain-containing protein [Bacteroidales bacterium]